MDDVCLIRTDDRVDALFIEFLNDSKKKFEFEYEFDVYIDYWKSNHLKLIELDSIALLNMIKKNEFTDLSDSALKVLLTSMKEKSLSNYDISEFLYFPIENRNDDDISIDEHASSKILEDEIEELVGGFPFNDITLGDLVKILCFAYFTCILFLMIFFYF